MIQKQLNDEFKKREFDTTNNWLSRNLRIEQCNDKETKTILIYDNDTNELLSQAPKPNPSIWEEYYPIGRMDGNITNHYFIGKY